MLNFDRWTININNFKTQKNLANQADQPPLYPQGQHRKPLLLSLGLLVLTVPMAMTSHAAAGNVADANFGTLPLQMLFAVSLSPYETILSPWNAAAWCLSEEILLDNAGSCFLFALALFILATGRAPIAKLLSLALPLELGQISFSRWMTLKIRSAFLSPDNLRAAEPIPCRKANSQPCKMRPTCA